MSSAIGKVGVQIVAARNQKFVVPGVYDDGIVVIALLSAGMIVDDNSQTENYHENEKHQAKEKNEEREDGNEEEVGDIYEEKINQSSS